MPRRLGRSLTALGIAAAAGLAVAAPAPPTASAAPRTTSSTHATAATGGQHPPRAAQPGRQPGGPATGRAVGNAPGHGGAPRETARAHVQASVAGVAPRIATPAADVTLTVTVKNTSDAPLTGLRATATLGGLRLSGRGAVGGWLASGAGPGAVVAQVSGPLDDSALAPGVSRTLTVTVPRAHWRLGRPFSVVPVEIAVSARTGVVGRTRTVVPWVASTPEFVPLQLAWAVPLTLPSDPALFSGSGQDSLTAWEKVVGPNAPARKVLAASTGTPVTWLVDPTLVEGPAYVTGATPLAAAAAATSADATATQRHATARTWTDQLVQSLRSLPVGQSVWALPPGDPDLAPLAGAPLPTSLAADAFPPGRNALDAAMTSTLPRATAWPADGVWSSARERGLAASTQGYPMTSALVSTKTLAAATGFTPAAAHRSPDGTGLLAYDEELSDIAGRTAPGSARLGRSDLVQRFLAESLVLLGEREGTTRSLVVTVPRGAPTDDATLRELWEATATAPWLRTTTLPAVAAELPTAPTARLVAPQAELEPPTPVSPAAVLRAGERAERLGAIGSILPTDRTAFAAAWRRADAQLLGSRWRGAPQAWRRLETTIDTTVTTAQNAVQIARPVGVNLLADSGRLAMTVTNSLPYPVHGVALTLTPGSPKLRVVSQPPPVTIQARSRAVVNVQVAALGSGEVPVEARLVTPSGALVGAPQTVAVNVRPPKEWILWVGAGLLGLVLVGGLTRALTRQPTRAERDDLGEPAPHPEAVPAPEGDR